MAATPVPILSQRSGNGSRHNQEETGRSWQKHAPAILAGARRVSNEAAMKIHRPPPPDSSLSTGRIRISVEARSPRAQVALRRPRAPQAGRAEFDEVRSPVGSMFNKDREAVSDRQKLNRSATRVPDSHATSMHLRRVKINS
jgi:hypothetical protein